MKTLRGILLILAFSAVVNAGSYTFTSSTGNTIDAGVNLVAGSTCDDCSVNISLPFSVAFGGVSYSNANLISNGSLQFTTADTAFTNSALPATSFGPSIIPHWDDLYLVNSGFGIFTSTTGSPVNQVFNIEWRAQYFPGTGSADFELRFYQNQSYFDFIYGTVTDGGNSATIGVQVSNTDFTQYCFNGGCNLSSGLGLRWDNAAVGVPEPASMSMIGLGAIGLLASRCFKRTRRA